MVVKMAIQFNFCHISTSKTSKLALFLYHSESPKFDYYKHGINLIRIRYSLFFCILTSKYSKFSPEYGRFLYRLFNVGGAVSPSLLEKPPKEIMFGNIRKFPSCGEGKKAYPDIPISYFS